MSEGATAVTKAAFHAIDESVDALLSEIADCESTESAMAIHAAIHERTMALLRLSTAAIKRAQEL